MFRQKAIDSRKTKWRGGALLLPTIPVWLVTTLSIVFFIILLLFVIFGSYIRRVNVSGELNHIIKQLNIGLLNPIPMVHQTESSECGLACLAMICGYHGQNIDLISLRQQFNLSSRGINLHGINFIAEELGLTTRVFSLDLNELSQLKTPCMLHWNFNHFVVLARSKKNRFIIHDPAQGRRTVGEKEFSQCFTGVALEAWPSSQFIAEEVRSRISLKILFRNIQGLKGALIKIFYLSIVIKSITIVMPIEL